MKNMSFVVLCVLIISCVSTPIPRPVAMRQPDDAQLGCQQIAIEYKSNTEVAADKIRRNQSGDTHDLIVGFFVWPGLADFDNPDGHEGNALLDRNVYLQDTRKLSQVKGSSFGRLNRSVIHLYGLRQTHKLLSYSARKKHASDDIVEPRNTRHVIPRSHFDKSRVLTVVKTLKEAHK